MKKALATLLGSASTLAFAATAFAAQVPPEPGEQAGTGVTVNPCADGSKGGTDFSGLCKLDADNIGIIIQTGVTILLVGAVLIALFFLIMGGIRWITSGGDKGKVESARNTIVAAVIGLVIAFLAYFILQLVLSVFGIELSELKMPKITG